MTKANASTSPPLSRYSRLNDSRATEHLVRLLGHSDPGIRRDAAEALRQLRDPRALQALMAALDDSAPPVRHCAAEALAVLGDPVAVPPLLEALQREDDEMAWGGIAWALAQFPSDAAVSSFRALLADDSVVGWRRTTVVYGLGLIGTPAGRQAVVESCADPDPNVRVEAVWALWEIGDKRACEALAAAAEDPVLRVRKAAGAALANINALGEPRRDQLRWIASS